MLRIFERKNRRENKGVEDFVPRGIQPLEGPNLAKSAHSERSEESVAVKRLAKKKEVHITVSTERREPESAKLMREHPFIAPGAKPLTREELYDRK